MQSWDKYLSTVPAPLKAADTIQKLFFERDGAATNQERLLIQKIFFWSIYFIKKSLFKVWKIVVKKLQFEYSTLGTFGILENAIVINNWK